MWEGRSQGFGKGSVVDKLTEATLSSGDTLSLEAYKGTLHFAELTFTPLIRALFSQYVWRMLVSPTVFLYCVSARIATWGWVTDMVEDRWEKKSQLKDSRLLGKSEVPSLLLLIHWVLHCRVFHMSPRKRGCFHYKRIVNCGSPWTSNDLAPFWYPIIFALQSQRTFEVIPSSHSLTL